VDVLVEALARLLPEVVALT